MGSLYEAVVEFLGSAVAYYGTLQKRCNQRMVGAFHGNCGLETQKYYVDEFSKEDSCVRFAHVLLSIDSEHQYIQVCTTIYSDLKKKSINSNTIMLSKFY